jgi:REP element-mobilizing transposase RayT
MPEHIHLPISEPDRGTPSTVMQVLKQRFSHRVLSELRRKERTGQSRLWQEASMWDTFGSAASTTL